LCESLIAKKQWYVSGRNALAESRYNYWAPPMMPKTNDKVLKINDKVEEGTQPAAHANNIKQDPDHD
jgi:hypothetical protein